MARVGGFAFALLDGVGLVSAGRWARRVLGCPTCGGSKLVRCTLCGGTGLWVAQGGHEVACLCCQGTGKMTCSDCQVGEVQFEVPESPVPTVSSSRSR